ncbi:MAG TPA: hypothetical protein H9697_07610 [Candidatus Mediterraneibacter faecavium]|uniref:Uncharacterized protein n=1 Tax=Candidatus Mediterraneibacter faecavium TaxID=2838668 RepID=A0A9D2Q8E7_9FIRM|nr:hypothetical protein [Candidatus Mediterraneibacter faecavium]
MQYGIMLFKEDAVKTKGCFIYPSQLFCRIAENANTNENVNTDLRKIFDEIDKIIAEIEE